jgi:hypothetical protein
MKQVISRLVFVIGIIAGVNVFIDVFFDGQEASNHAYLNRYKAALKNEEPEIVLLGNSMLDEAVDSRILSLLLGAKCIKIAQGGSASAAWYLTLKNVVVPAKKKPRFVVLFFRDIFLTYPSYRVTGAYRSYLMDISVGEESLIQNLAYKKDPVERLLEKGFPTYAHRKIVTNQLDSVIKSTLVGSMMDLSEAEVNSNISKVFDDKNMDAKIVTKQQAEAESVEESDLYDFDFALNKSFLPHIISMMRETGIRLIFVRMKRRRDIQPGKESAELVAYISDLQKYLTLHRIPLIDFTPRPEIRIEHFGKGDHLEKPKGLQLFTELVAKELKPLIR